MLELYIRFYDEIVSVSRESLTSRLGAERMFFAEKLTRLSLGVAVLGGSFFIALASFAKKSFQGND
jgi:hypothetical protein